MVYYLPFQSLIGRMNAKPKRRSISENGDGGPELGLATSIANGDDLGPVVRLAFEAGKHELILNQLRNIVKKKEAEIEELCKLHYEDFILAVDELRGILNDTYQLKSMLSGENSQLQEVASSLLMKVDEILEMYSVKKNVSEAIRTLNVCIQVLTLCLKCNQQIKDCRFHPALKMVDLIEKEYLQGVPLKALRKVIEKQIPEVRLHIEKKVCGEFNDWLVYIRDKARDIAQMAIRQAASARQRDEEMRDKQRDYEEQSNSGLNEFVYALDTEQMEDDSLVEFDLTPLYRAYHIHSCLGKEDMFRKQYNKERLAQLNLDLQISQAQSFLESHQNFFAQIAGFFIVEDRVLQTVVGFLSESQLESMWDTALQNITSVLEDQFCRMDTASHLLLIKDFVTLIAMALRRYGYKVGPLLDVLDNSRDKYHELLLNDCRKQITEVLASDTFEQVVIRKENEYDANILSFRLQVSDVMPLFPYVAPFSSSVPEACRIVRSFIKDSVSYLKHGGQINFYDTVKKYVDKLLVDVLNEALLKAIQSGSSGASQVMQIAANTAALERACEFFLSQIAHLCSIPLRLVERPHSSLTAKTSLKLTQVVAYNSLLILVKSKVDELMVLMSKINWMPDEEPDNENEYIDEVLIYLNSLLSTAQQILSLDALYKIASGILDHISHSIVTAFLSENVKKFNLNAIVGIDNDLKMLESFADDQFQNSGLIDLKEGGSLRDYLVEARQLVNLLLSHQPDNFMNPEIREKHYGALDHKKVSIICEKYKDSPDTLFGSLSNKNAKQSARKKSMDMLKKRLKELN